MVINFLMFCKNDSHQILASYIISYDLSVILFYFLSEKRVCLFYCLSSCYLWWKNFAPWAFPAASTDLSTLINITLPAFKRLTSLSSQSEALKTGMSESTGLSSSVYVFIRILSLNLSDKKLYTSCEKMQAELSKYKILIK